MSAPRCKKAEESIGDRIERLKDMAWLLLCATYAMKELSGELTADALARAAAMMHDELIALAAALSHKGAA